MSRTRGSLGLNTKEILRLHVQEFLSTQKIADLLGYKKNSVIWVLRHNNVLRKSPGVLIENQVFELIKKQNPTKIVRHFRGDWPFDLTIDRSRYDIKSSVLSSDNRYHFEIQHADSIKKKTAKDIDFLLLVFMDNKEIYSLPFKDVEHFKRSFSLKKGKTKYNLTYVGRL